MMISMECITQIVKLNFKERCCSQFYVDEADAYIPVKGMITVANTGTTGATNDRKK